MTLIERIKKNKYNSFVPVNYFTKSSEGKWHYMVYRIMRPVTKVRYHFFRKRFDPSPWLSPAAISFFNEWLDGTQVGCEFGSGGSTLFFSGRVKQLVSIEHNKEWYDKITAGLPAALKDKITYRFVPENDPAEAPETLPELEAHPELDDFEYRKKYFNYIYALHDLPDESFDFIIVDGRARTECVIVNLQKLKPGGLLVLDNSERDRYLPVFRLLKGWEYAWTTNGLTDTVFWLKPVSETIPD